MGLLLLIHHSPTLAVFILSNLVIDGICGSTGGSIWPEDPKFEGKLTLGLNPAEAIQGVPCKGRCLFHCKAQPGCTGFYYNGDTRICRLTTWVPLFKNMEIPDDGSRYYRATPLQCPQDRFVTYVLEEKSGTCYKLNNADSTWDNARTSCHNDAGDLAVLDTQDKEKALLDFFNDGYPFAKYYHIGGLRPRDHWDTPWPSDQPDFLWLTGEAVDLASPYWATTEPNNGGQQENIMVIYHSNQGWRLGDARETSN